MEHTENPDDMLTPHDVSAMLNVKYQTARDLPLPWIRIGRRLRRVRRSELNAWLAARSTPGAIAS